MLGWALKSIFRTILTPENMGQPKLNYEGKEKKSKVRQVVLPLTM